MNDRENAKRSAFSRIDLCALVAAALFLALLVLQAQIDGEDAAKRNRIGCVNHLKQIGLALRIFSNDHGDRFPMHIPMASGGSEEAVARGETHRHFQAIAQELNKVELLVCPADQRKPAADFGKLQHDNLSYFVGLDADETRPQTILSGDRNLTNGIPPSNTILELSEKVPAGWTEILHGAVGNLGLADGSVQQLTVAMLRRQIEQAAQSNADRNGRVRIQLPVATGSGSEE